MARTKAEQSGDMEGDAERIRARRERLGISKAELAREAKVSRTTMNAMEAGEGFQRSTLTKVERALARFEREAGFEPPPQPAADEDVKVVEVELPDGRKARVTVKVSADPAEVTAQLAAILEWMSQEGK